MFTIFEKSVNHNSIGGGHKFLSMRLGNRERYVTVGAPVVHQPCTHALRLSCWSCTLMLVHMECATWCVIWQQHKQKLDKHDHTSKIRTHDLTLAYLTTIAVNPGEDAW